MDADGVDVEDDNVEQEEDDNVEQEEDVDTDNVSL
jgi:hypothetical protein